MTRSDSRSAIEAALRAACGLDARFSMRYENGHPILAAATESFFAFEDPWAGWCLRQGWGEASRGFDPDRPRSIIAAAERLARAERLRHVPLPVDLDLGRWQVLGLELRAGDAEARLLAETDAVALHVYDVVLGAHSTIVLAPGAPLAGQALEALFGTHERLERWSSATLRHVRRAGESGEAELGLRIAPPRPVP